MAGLGPRLSYLIRAPHGRPSIVMAGEACSRETYPAEAGGRLSNSVCCSISASRVSTLAHECRRAPVSEAHGEPCRSALAVGHLDFVKPLVAIDDDRTDPRGDEHADDEKTEIVEVVVERSDPIPEPA